MPVPICVWLANSKGNLTHSSPPFPPSLPPPTGVGYFGQLGHGDDISCDRPRMIHQLDPPRLGGDHVVAIACGGLHSAVSTAGQSVYCFGFNRYGQVGQGQTSNKISTPRPVNMNVIGRSRGREGSREGEKEILFVRFAASTILTLPPSLPPSTHRLRKNTTARLRPSSYLRAD